MTSAADLTGLQVVELFCARFRQEDGFHGLLVDGRRFDIGLPEHYLETLRTFQEA